MLDLPEPNILLAGIVFGIIGYLAFRYGKRESQIRPLFLGIALMVYPYFITGFWLVWGIGIGLSALLYYWRE